MKIDNNSKQNFTSVIPVRFYKRDLYGNARLCNDYSLLKILKPKAVKLLSGPAKDDFQKNLMKLVSGSDPDYDYSMAVNGVFKRKIENKFQQRPAREFLKFISEHFSGTNMLLTGSEASKIADIGEKIGKIKKQCMNATARANGIPEQGSIVNGALYKWSKFEKDIINKHLVNASEIKDQRHKYGNAIREAVYSPQKYMTSSYNPLTKQREGQKSVLNFLINDNNDIIQYNITAYK